MIDNETEMFILVLFNRPHSERWLGQVELLAFSTNIRPKKKRQVTIQEDKARMDTWNPKIGGLQDDYPFQLDDF